MKMENINITAVMRSGTIHPAAISNQSHFPIPEAFWMYSIAHIAVKTEASQITAQVMVMAIPCMFDNPIKASKHDKHPTDNSISTSQIENPIHKVSIP